MNRIFQDIQNGLSSALLRPILNNPVHPVYVPFILRTRLCIGEVAQSGPVCALASLATQPGPLCATLAEPALKTESQRPLHHARWAGIGRLTETSIGLNDLIVGVIDDQIGINVVEIRVVEKVICLPSELEANLLAHADVLEHRQVKVDEPGTAKQISRRVADLSPCCGLGEARSVNEDGSSIG